MSEQESVLALKKHKHKQAISSGIDFKTAYETLISAYERVQHKNTDTQVNRLRPLSSQEKSNVKANV